MSLEGLCMSSYSIVGFIALGAIASATNQIVRRYALKGKDVTASEYSSFTFGSACIAFGILYVLLWGVTFPNGLLHGFFTAVVLGSFANVVIQGLNAKTSTYKLGEASYVAPLQSMTPMLITLTALTLGEFPSWRGWLGVFVMSLGTYILAFDKKPTSILGYLTPLTRVVLVFFNKERSPAEREKGLVTLLALCSAAMGTIGLLFDGLMVRRSGGMQGIVFGSVILCAILSFAYAPAALHSMRKRGQVAGTVCKYPALPVWVLIVFALLWISMVLCTQPQFSHSFVAYVGTLKRLNVLFTVILGWLVLKERDFGRRMVAAVCIIMGAVLIATDAPQQLLLARMAGIGL